MMRFTRKKPTQQRKKRNKKKKRWRGEDKAHTLSEMITYDRQAQDLVSKEIMLAIGN